MISYNKFYKGKDGPKVVKSKNGNVNYVYPKIDGRGIFHSKMMILEFDDRLRVVISSCDLIHFEWERFS